MFVFVTATPLHASVAAKVFSHDVTWAVFPAPSHSTVVFAGQVVIVGRVVSATVTVPLHVWTFPQSSRAVNVTAEAPVAPQPAPGE